MRILYSVKFYLQVLSTSEGLYSSTDFPNIFLPLFLFTYLFTGLHKDLKLSVIIHFGNI